MLGDAGSIASLVGVVVSLGGLGFALWQLSRLRGETRAARESAEATRRAGGRDLALTDVTRLNERLQALKQIHRDGNKQRALDRYPEIIELFVDVRRRQPGLSQEARVRIQRAINDISAMERDIEPVQGNITPELAGRCNRTLTDLQSTLLPELEDRLQQLEDT